MYQMILIDDEPAILNELKEAIKWEDYGFEIAGVFRNGRSALEFIKENHVDAAITDIRMPVMDGLEFAEKINNEYPHIKVVLVSAYRDFEYARKAIINNVTEYLVKPMRYEDLVSCVNTLKSKLNFSAEENSFIDNNTQLEFQKIFSDLFCGFVGSDLELQKQLEKINIYVDPDMTPCAVINLHIENFDTYIKNVWKHGLSRFYVAVNRLIPYESLFLYVAMFRYFGGNIEFFALARCKESRFCKALDELIFEFSKNMKEFFKCDVTVSVGDVYSSLSELVKNNKKELFSEYDAIDNAIHYIEENYGKNLSLENVSGYVCLSPVYFSSLFKKRTGRNFLNYLTDYRIDQARKMLKNSNIPISSICETVGYKSQTHFYQLFEKKNDGLTPMEYRQLYVKRSEE